MSHLTELVSEIGVGVQGYKGGKELKLFAEFLAYNSARSSYHMIILTVLSVLIIWLLQS